MRISDPFTLRPTPENLDWLRGPELARWIHARYTDVEAQLGRSKSRMLRRWEKGGAAEVWSVDQVLVRLGGHLHELPEGVWRERPVPRRRSECELEPDFGQLRLPIPAEHRERVAA
jgi:hypothetical protein